MLRVNMITGLKVNIEMKSLRPSNMSVGNITKLTLLFMVFQTNWKIFIHLKEILVKEMRSIRKKGLESNLKIYILRTLMLLQVWVLWVVYKCLEQCRVWIQLNRQDLMKWTWQIKKLVRWDQIHCSKGSHKKKLRSLRISLSKV